MFQCFRESFIHTTIILNNVYNSRCSNKAIAPARCSAGEYAPQGQDSCTPCEKGFQCPNTTLGAPIPCSNGTYTSSTGQTSCSICTAGNYCPLRAQGEIVCLNGTYSKAGSTVCTECPAGYK